MGGGWWVDKTPNLVFCFGPKLWFWPRPKLNNSKVVNFLDVTLDLNTGIFKNFMKENDTPVYVNVKSNHPPTILKIYLWV